MIKNKIIKNSLAYLLCVVMLISIVMPIGTFAAENTIGEFNANLVYSGTTLTVTLVPTVTTATANNLWYTDIANPTALAQAKAGYNTGAKNSSGNYEVTIPNASIGAFGLVNLFLSTNIGDTGWVAFNINGTEQETVATPTFSVEAGTYTAAQQVAITSATAGATIRYTTDGTTPTETSSVYSTPIAVSSTSTIKAIAYKDGLTASAVVSATYTINVPIAVTGVSLNKNTSSIAVGANETLVAIITPSNATNKNVNWTSSNTAVATVDSTGKVVGVTAGTATITVTTAEGNKTATCQVTVTAAPVSDTIGQFNASFSLSGTTLTVTLVPTVSSATANNLWYTDIANPTALAQAKAGYSTGAKNSSGNYVVTIPNASIGANGLINLYLSTNTGDTGWKAFNVSTPVQDTVATPVFSVAQGTYADAQQVAITCATAGATIRYTTNGTTPTETSSVYSSAINVSVTTTIKAAAYKSGMTASAVASATYTIDEPIPDTVATPTFSVAGGTYTTAQQVAITSATAGATIRYTTNGTEPTETSSVYSSVINVSATTTIKAAAYKAGMTASVVASATYTITIVVNSDTVQVGSGGYTLVPYGSQLYGNDVHARSAELAWLPVGDKRKTTENVTGPLPTTDWATSLVWGTMWTGYNQKYSEALYAIPTIFKPYEGGIKMETPPKQIINGGKDIQKHYEDAFVDINIGGTGFSAVDARADKITDWQYDIAMSNSDKSKSLKATIMHGNPFGYFYFNNMTPQITFTRGLPVKIISGNANSNVLLIKAADNYDGGKFNFYGIYAPAGTTWNLTGTVDNVTGLTANMPSGKNYISIASLPYTIKSTETENTTTINSIFNTFKNYAYNYVTDTKISYSYNQATRQLTTNFQFTTDNKAESTAAGTITALFPHQYRNDATNNYIGYSYDNTIRGDLKVVAGTSFTTTEQYTGVLPTMPSWSYSDSEKAQMRAYLDELISTDTYINTANPMQGLNATLDTYWAGKEMSKLSNALTVAEQIGYTEVADILYKTIKGELEAWFTPTDSNGQLKNDKFFYYNEELGTVIGYPSGFGSDTQLNDHHFHYGYFINAAAQVAMRDSTWASRWGGMVQLLIDDIANTNRNSTMFPYLRAMDPYEGHSWASGHAQFGDGNNQESSSEAVNAWTGVILWGEATNSQTVRDLGIYLYSTEKSAIHEYWYDQYNEIFDDAFNYEAVGMIWGGKYSFGTWWTANPVETYGINVLPLAGGAFYLAEFKDKISAVYNDAYIKGAAVNYADKGSAGATYWQDIMVKYLALDNPATAIANWRSDLAPEEGETKAFTYYWLHGLDKNGTFDTSTYALNSALSVVLVKNDIKTYVAYNPTSVTKEVQFSNGVSIQVAAHSLYTGTAN